MTAAPPLPIADLDIHAKLRIILRSLLDVFYPSGEVFGVTIAEVDSGVDDISLLVKRVLRVLVENT